MLYSRRADGAPELRCQSETGGDRFVLDRSRTQDQYWPPSSATELFVSFALKNR